MSQCSRRLAVALLLAPSGALVGSLGRVARAAQGLGEFAAGPAPCKPDEKATPAAPEGPDFKRNAPARASLIEPGVTGTRLVVSGTVAGLHCGPIKSARLDFWQADARGVYDRTGFRLRGYQLTDAAGSYRLETIVPGAHDRRAPRLHVRVQPPGEPVFITQLFFADQPENKTDPEFRSELTVPLTDLRGAKAARFNIVLDL